MQRPVLRLGWSPRPLTVVPLLIAGVTAAWLLSPPWWNQLGTDSRVFYSAAAVADAGGNPYDFDLLRAEEARINAESPAAARGAFSPAPYGYPPIMTALYGLLLPLGERGFYAATVIILLVALGLAYRLTAAALDWVDLRLGAAALLVSAPSILGLVSGNPSNLLFLAWAAGFFLLARGRPVLAGLTLALTLVKPPIGVAVSAALIVALPPGAGAALLGFAVGSALFMALNLLALGPGAMAEWGQALVGFGSNINVPGSEYGQCCLAGLPALLLNRVFPSLATVLAALVVAAILAYALRRPEARAAFRESWTRRAAILTALALAASPYIHLNDLVLLTPMLMLVAATRPRWTTVPLLSAWAIGAAGPLLVSLVLAQAFHHAVVSVVGYGVLLSALALLALTRLLGDAAAPRPVVARTRRPWGPVPRA